MTPKNRDAALVEYQRQIGKVLNCVAHCWVYSYPSKKAGKYLLIAAPAGAPKTGNASQYFLRVKRGKEALLFRSYQHFELLEDQEFRISTQKYYYSVWSNPAERLIDFHYHDRKSDSYHGHLHIPSDGAKSAVHPLMNKHIPTAHIPLEDVVRFLIQELGVDPRRADWNEVLCDAQQIFNASRTR
jgi:hypothetical protein